MERILITGGAGFIGSHLADGLIERGYRVRVLDTLNEQVHGDIRQPPEYLNPAVEFMHGDVRDAGSVREALREVDAVFHFAAAVGVGQSMYQIERYTDINNRGTAVLLQRLIEQPVKKLTVASSMSVYGEGLYRTSDGRTCAPPERPLAQLQRGDWELRDERGEALQPMPTPESKITSPASVYALSKYDQERLCLLVGQAYNIPTVALRFFNVYGTRQALSNPYTGVLAIFASRYLNGNSPLIFEDGEQRRDFVNIRDLVQACLLSLERDEAAGRVFNVGSGRNYTVREIAEHMGRLLGKEDIQPVITRNYRVGDIRHCFADIGEAQDILGYRPRIGLEEGMAELVEWLQTQAAFDRFEAASEELSKRGLRL
ncbi:SDR family NAD(P)-dependent oxidoreductase [Methylocaldum sp.]|uniref:SDR family NAD(P)-dependent oxidoreductase n=1 Tax=Methylocaldum sp. TaxID=1969727 RepID=UPI002D47E7CB|nr:SDR family NAD(P)-dependent oxidoreductase [Methylocaldum sp.]HYE33873.1 SDR family NAD(P)-dependent oxidoreductase [Methylocaldum sp.]